MTALLAMVQANLKMSLRNRAALFWNLAFPAIFIVIFGLVFGPGTGVELDTGSAGAESTFRDDEVTGQEVSFMDVFAPGILAMSLMNSGVIGLATAFVTYRERGILRRIRVTPFPLTSFILARVLSQLLIAGLQAVVLIGMAWAFFGLHLRGNALALLVAIVAGALAFLAIGFAISGIAPSAETAASYANLITFPMLFLSGVFFSMESAPAWLQPITRVLPLSYLVAALREALTFGHGLAEIWTDLLALALTFVIAMAIAVRFFRWDTRPA